MIKLLTFLLLLIPAFNVIAAKTIKAVTLSYPPYEYLEDGEPRGLVIDIITEAMIRINNKKINFSFYPWGRSVLETKNGNQDILFNAGVNEERKRWGTYIDSVLIKQKYMLFALNESKFTVNKNIDNVNALAVGTRMHFLYGDGVLRKALDNGHFKRVSAVNSIEQSVKMLLKKRIDLFVGDYLPVMHYLEQHCLLDDIRIIKDQTKQSNLVVLNWNTHLLISKKSPVMKEVKKINQALIDMKKDGTFHKISQPYYQFSKSKKDCHVL